MKRYYVVEFLGAHINVTEKTRNEEIKDNDYIVLFSDGTFYSISKIFKSKEDVKDYIHQRTQLEIKFMRDDRLKDLLQTNCKNICDYL